MKNFRKIWLASFLSVYLLAGLLLFVPNTTLASDSAFDVDTNVNFTPQVSIPESEFTAQEKVGVGTTGINKKGETVVTSDLLAKYINAFYQWGLSIAAIIAVLTLMASGIVWITSRGDSSAITKAKGMIAGSLTGITLLVGAWFILNTINPQLTKLPAIEMVVINKIKMGCCDVSKDDGKAKMTSDSNCKSGFSEKKQLTANGICELESCCVIKVCDKTYGCTADTANYCINTLASTCARIEKDSNVDAVSTLKVVKEVKVGDCDEIPECSAKVISCAGKNDAAMGLMQVGSQQEYWCYGGKFYFSTGIVGEPCGNEPYSKCTTEYLSNAADYNGRDCCNALTAGCTRAWCNKFKADGTKKYDQDIQK